MCPALAPPPYIPYIRQTMNRPVHSKTFKSGNSVAVRLPKTFAIPAGAEVEISRSGNRVTMKLTSDPDEAKRQWQAALDELRALPKPPSIQKRERFEFPDRPGL